MNATPYWYRRYKETHVPSRNTALQMGNAMSSQGFLQLLVVITLLSSTHALIGSDEQQAAQFNNQLLLQNPPASKIKSRLQTLLELRRSISSLIHQRDDIPQTSDFDSTEDTKQIVTDKRVFCNGFTGCGGRFRGRSVQQLALEDMRKRMQKAAASKRPFCNTNGCFNGGKRKKGEKAGPSPVRNKSYYFNDGFSKAGSGTDTALRRSGMDTKEKRLFCNGYGGCRNMGKRGILLPLLIGDVPSSDVDFRVEKSKPVYEIKLEPSKDKRFFASSYDSSMDNFVNSL